MRTFDFSTLITDRTSADVSAISALIAKIENGTATEEESALFNAAAMKGAYNYKDLNRVTAAMEYLDEALRQYGYVTGYEPVIIDHRDGTASTVWLEEEAPAESRLVRYLANVLTIYSTILTDPELPETMAKLDYNGANQIEQALVIVSEAIERIVAGFARSGCFTFWSGNRPFPCAKSDLGRTWAELDTMNTTWRNWQVASWYLLLYGNLEAEGDVT